LPALPIQATAPCLTGVLFCGVMPSSLSSLSGAGMTFICILLAFRTASRRVKRLAFMRALGPITVCSLSIALMNIFDWYQPPALPAGSPPGTKPPAPPIKPVGSIPKGMPDFTATLWLPLIDPARQLLLAVVICLLDICESMSSELLESRGCAQIKSSRGCVRPSAAPPDTAPARPACRPCMLPAAR
jgi:hypothetical protein